MEVKVEYTTPTGTPSERSMMVGLKSDKIRRRRFDMMLNGADMAYHSPVTVTIQVGNVKYVGVLTTPLAFEKTAWWRTDELFCQLHGTHIVESGRRVFCAGKLHVNITRLDRLDRIVAEEAARAAPAEDWFQVRRSACGEPNGEPRVCDVSSEAPPPYPVSQLVSEATDTSTVDMEQSSEEEDLKSFRVVINTAAGAKGAATSTIKSDAMCKLPSRDSLGAPWSKSDMTNKMHMMTQMINRTIKYLDGTQQFLDEMRAMKEIYEMYD